jgi:hypothetical protein
VRAQVARRGAPARRHRDPGRRVQAQGDAVRAHQVVGPPGGQLPELRQRAGHDKARGLGARCRQYRAERRPDLAEAALLTGGIEHDHDRRGRQVDRPRPPDGGGGQHKHAEGRSPGHDPTAVAPRLTHARGFRPQ